MVSLSAGLAIHTYEALSGTFQLQQNPVYDIAVEDCTGCTFVCGEIYYE